MKRKGRSDDPAVGYAQFTTKRLRTQSSASRSRGLQAKSPSKEMDHIFARLELPTEGPSVSSALKNGEDEAFGMTLGNFMGFKRQAADKSSKKSTGEKSSASPKKSVIKKQSTQVSSVFIPSGLSCVDTHIMNDSCGRNDGNPTEKATTEGSRDDIIPTQEIFVEQCSSDFGRNVCTLGVSTHHGQDGLQIADSLVFPQEVTVTQCQSLEDCQHFVARTDATLVNIADAAASLLKENTESWLHHKKRRASRGKRSISSIKRSLEERSLSFPWPGISEGCSENMKCHKKQKKESNGTMLPEVPRQANSSYSLRRRTAAKSKWKNLLQSILRTQTFPERLASANKNLVKDQDFSKGNVPGNDHSHGPTDSDVVYKHTRFIAKSKHNKTLSQPKKRIKPSAAANTLTRRLRQKKRIQRVSLLKRMRAWLAEARFSQGTKENTSDNIGEEFMMTDEERSAFAQCMVQSCQRNPNMRIVFLESMRRLTSSGLLQAAASNLLLQGTCDEAQAVVDAGAKFKEQNAITKTLPMDLLSAVNQLHEKRGDLLTKLGTPNAARICTMSRIDEKTWKFQLPRLTPGGFSFTHKCGTGNRSMKMLMA